MENYKARILWDFSIQAGKQLLANQTDIMAINKDIAITSNWNFRKKECEKLEKYKGRKEELEKIAK